MDLTLLAGKFGVLALFVPLAMGCLFGLGFSVLGLLRWRKLRRWAPVAARVLDLDLETSEYRGALGRRIEAYDLVVRYGYQAGGVEYEAAIRQEIDVPRVGGRALPEHLESALERDSAQYASGEMTIFVDPADPAMSGQRLASGRLIWLMFIIFLLGAVGFTALSVALLLAA